MSSSSATKAHLSTLDGLRGVAAVAVVLFHRRWWVPGADILEHAYLAVDFFFALSGFVIAHAYQRRLSSGLSVSAFCRLRVIRLLPLVLAGGLLAGAFYLLRELRHGSLPDPALALALLAACFALPAPMAVSVNPQSAFPINNPTWSLFFEFVVNVGFAAFLPWLSRRVMIALAGASLALLSILGFGLDGISQVGHTYVDFFGGIPRTTFSFLMGVLLHSLRAEGRLPKVTCPPILLAGLLVATFIPPTSIPGNVWYDLICVAVVFPAIIVAGAQVEPTGSGRRIAAISGELSYPIYVLHYPLFRWYEAFVGQDSPTNLGGATLLIVVVSYVVLRVYDIPVRKWLSMA